jgi:hypothetical protein
MKSSLFTAIFFLGVSLLHGQQSQFYIGGYLKYLFSYSDLPAYGGVTDHLLHNRINTKWYTTDALTLACEVRTRFFYGGTVEHTPDFTGLIRNNHEFVRGDAVLLESKKSVGYTEIDRLYADWNSEPWQATVGRQRFAFGTNLVWNPTDFFNPLSVLDFDYEERPGFDGIHVQYYTGPLSKIEIASKPGKTSSTSITVAAFTTNIMEYDLHLLFGKKNGLWAAGASWAGSISGGGFRGEVVVSEKPLQGPDGSFNSRNTEGTMTSIALSGDYTFSNSLYLHFEPLYNSAGTTRDAAVYIVPSQNLGLLSPARWSLFGEISYDISPLLRASVFTLLNPYDRSSATLPSLNWSVITNLDFTAIAVFFNGASGTEFGNYGKSVYLRLKASF